MVCFVHLDPSVFGNRIQKSWGIRRKGHVCNIKRVIPISISRVNVSIYKCIIPPVVRGLVYSNIKVVSVQIGPFVLKISFFFERRVLGHLLFFDFDFFRFLFKISSSTCALTSIRNTQIKSGSLAPFEHESVMDRGCSVEAVLQVSDCSLALDSQRQEFYLNVCRTIIEEVELPVSGSIVMVKMIKRFIRTEEV